MRLRSKIWRLESAVEKIFAPHCFSDSSTLNFHSPESSLDHLERSGSTFLMTTGAFGHFNVLERTRLE